jgi:hypothetical protein
MPDADSSKLKLHQRWSEANSLIFNYGNLGLMAIEPGPLSRRDIPFTDYLIFPRPIPANQEAAAHLWVEARECPIFCVKDDLENFLRAGFGSHKFTVLEGYREISVEGGSVTFYPAGQEKHVGIKGILSELMEAFGLRPKKSFHVKLKTRNCKPTLFLANPMIEALDVRILSEEEPGRIIALPGYPDTEWLPVAKVFGKPVELAYQVIPKIGMNPHYLNPEAKVEEQSV